MTRKKKVIQEADGTPVEIDEDVEDIEAVTSELPRKRVVEWTEKGEKAGAFSEHGQHVAGEHVETDSADLLIEYGFAKDLT